MVALKAITLEQTIQEQKSISVASLQQLSLNNFIKPDSYKTLCSIIFHCGLFELSEWNHGIKSFDVSGISGLIDSCICPNPSTDEVEKWRLFFLREYLKKFPISTLVESMPYFKDKIMALTALKSYPSAMLHLDSFALLLKDFPDILEGISISDHEFAHTLLKGEGALFS